MVCIIPDKFLQSAGYSAAQLWGNGCQYLTFPCCLQPESKSVISLVEREKGEKTLLTNQTTQEEDTLKCCLFKMRFFHLCARLVTKNISITACFLTVCEYFHHDYVSLDSTTVISNDCKTKIWLSEVFLLYLLDFILSPWSLHFFFYSDRFSSVKGSTVTDWVQTAIFCSAAEKKNHNGILSVEPDTDAISLGPRKSKNDEDHAHLKKSAIRLGNISRMKFNLSGVQNCFKTICNRSSSRSSVLFPFSTC